MLNHIVLMGRLTRDPELRRTSSGVAVASFSLAVDRDFGGNRETGEKETDFIDIVAWRNTAEFVSKYFTKGRMAVVSGRLQIRNWNDKDGNKRRSAEVVADNIYFGDSRRDSQPGGYDQSYGQPAYSQPGYNQQPSYGGQSYGGYGQPAPAPAPAPASDFAMLEDDDSELPF
ncbi:MAG: single-stranded DNA-binding protein [Candidatus Avoscillospira sp.]